MYWYSKKIQYWLYHYSCSLNYVSVLLWPVSLLYKQFALLRRFLYKNKIFKQGKIDVPVIIIGNISVGGTGKTPVVCRLVELFREAGYKPGVISRGYGGHSKNWPCYVNAESDPYIVGDESVLIAKRCKCPIVVGPDRFISAFKLVKVYGCNIIISDDGLQHYRLYRDIEVAVVDGLQRFGNAACLPAGPLREPPTRLNEVDFIIGHGIARINEYLMVLDGDIAINLADHYISSRLQGFERYPVHAVAGIGNPWRFFEQLRRAGLRTIEHPFPDHYNFSKQDLCFKDQFPILMTEKDAIKCSYRGIQPINSWYVPVTAIIDSKFEIEIVSKIKGLIKSNI